MPKLVHAQEEAHCSEHPLEKHEYAVAEKPQVFGRISLNVRDQRLSRNQIELWIENSEKGQELKAKQLGMNPSVVLRKSGEKIMLAKDQIVNLVNGDLLFLVGDCYPFRISELEEIKLHDVIKEVKTPDNSKMEIELEDTSKRKASQIEPEMKWLSPKKKKLESPQKTQSNSTESNTSNISSNANISNEETAPLPKEVTLNIASESAEPPKVEVAPTPNLASKDAPKVEEFSESLKQLRDMFPDIPTSDIKEALHLCKGNLDEALDKLLSFTPKEAKLPEKAPVKVEPKVSPSKSAAVGDSLKDEILALRKEEEEKKRKLAEQELQNQKLIIEMLTKEKEEIEKKSHQLLVKRSELESARYMDGELEALKGSRVKKYTLKPERGVEKDAGQIHFRTAESQFHRLLETKSFTYQVNKVEYIVNPKLFAAFEKKRTEVDN